MYTINITSSSVFSRQAAQVLSPSPMSSYVSSRRVIRPCLDSPYPRSFALDIAGKSSITYSDEKGIHRRIHQNPDRSFGVTIPGYPEQRFYTINQLYRNMILDTGSVYTPSDILLIAGNAGIIDITGVKFINRIYKYSDTIDIAFRSFDPFIAKINIRGRYFARVKYIPAINTTRSSSIEIIRGDTVYIVKYDECMVIKKKYSDDYDNIETAHSYNMTATKHVFSCLEALDSYLEDELGETGEEAIDIIKNKIVELHGKI
jgi:hypothetical protein